MPALCVVAVKYSAHNIAETISLNVVYHAALVLPNRSLSK